jgi:hypothetical protein
VLSLLERRVGLGDGGLVCRSGVASYVLRLRTDCVGAAVTLFCPEMLARIFLVYSIRLQGGGPVQVTDILSPEGCPLG